MKTILKILSLSMAIAAEIVPIALNALLVIIIIALGGAGKK